MRNDPEFLSTLRETNTQCPRCLLARQTALSEGRCLIRTGGWGGGVGTTHIRLSHESSVPRRPTPKPGLLSALCVLKAGFDRNLCACGRICSSYACLEHVNESYLILTLWQKEEKNSHNHTRSSIQASTRTPPLSKPGEKKIALSPKPLSRFSCGRPRWRWWTQAVVDARATPPVAAPE